MSKVKALYDTLNSNGDLEEMFPSMTGDWEKDKSAFKKQYNINERIVEDLNQNLDGFDNLFDDDLYDEL